jgi:hypothetical protein
MYVIKFQILAQNVSISNTKNTAHNFLLVKL